jgi:hypothetical protein
MSKRPLPPLSTDTAYEAADFERFEFAGAILTGRTAILRLHLKNGTTVDVPASDEQLRHPRNILQAAFPE